MNTSEQQSFEDGYERGRRDAAFKSNFISQLTENKSEEEARNKGHEQGVLDRLRAEADKDSE